MSKKAKPEKTWTFTVDKERIAGALGRVLGAVDKRSTIPGLSHVKLDVLLRGAVHLSATDLEVYAGAECSATVPGSGGSICVPAELLKGSLAGLNGEVSLALQPDLRLVVEGDGRRFELACLPAEEFPAPPLAWDSTVCHFEPGVLPRLLRAVGHAASQDDAKHNLCGVYLCQDRGRLTAVATDGHRLALAGIEIPGLDFDDGFLLPAKAARILASVEGPVSLALGTPGKNDNQVYFDGGDFDLAVRLIDGQFPDYRRVIPENHPDHFTVDLSSLAEAVEAVTVVSDGKARSVKLSAPEDLLGESLTVSALGTCGIASATVPCMGGTGYLTAVNSRYLLQSLKALGGEGFIQYGGNSPPIVIVPVDHGRFDERIEVVMPYKVSS